MKLVKNIGLSVIVGLALTACGSSDNSGGSTVTGGSTATNVKVIATKEDAINASAALTSLNGASNTGNSGYASPRRAASLAQTNQTIACSNGGSQTIVGETPDYNSNYSANTSINLVTNYDNCDNYGVVQNGKVTVKRDSSGDVNTVLSNFRTTKTDGTYTEMNYQMKTALLANSSDSESLLNGKILFDYKENGKGSYTYDNFKIIMNQAATQLDLSGKIGLETDKYSCLNGTYNVETVDKLILNDTRDGYSDGTMKLNGVSYEYHTDGTAKVTFLNGDSVIIDQGAKPTCK